MFQRRRTGPALGWAVIVVFAAAIGFTALGTASAAPAVVPGTYTITVTGGDGAIGKQALKLGPACSNGSDDDLDTKVDHPADAECASPTDSNEGPDNTPYAAPTFTVDIDAAGNISAPAANVKWQDIWQRQDTGVPLGIKDLLIRFVPDNVAAKSVTGHLDAATGAISLTWRFHIETSIVGVPGTVQIGTPAKPLEANLSSSTSGGSPFDPATLAATLVDDQIVYPGAACVGNAFLCPTIVTTANATLGLPTKPGDSPLKVFGEVDRNPIEDAAADAPDLTLAKSHIGDFTVGVDGSYSLLVSNVGSAASSGVVTVTDTLPAGLAYTGFTGAGWTCSPAGQVVTCTSSTSIAADGEAAPLSVTVNPSAPGAVTNTASVSNTGDTNAANDATSDPTTVAAEPPPDEADLTLTKSHAGDFAVGVDGTYALVVSNVGGAASAGDVTVADTLPAGLAYKGFTGTGWSCTDAGQVVTCTATAPVAAGGQASPLSLTVTPSAAATVTNTASVSGGGQSNTLNDGASDPTIVVGAEPTGPELALTKSHDGNFKVGVEGTWVLQVANVGDGPTTEPVTLGDALPAEVDFAGFALDDDSGWACDEEEGSVACTHAGPLESGDSLPPVGVVVEPKSAGTVTNAAVAASGELSASATDTAEVDPAQPALKVGVETPELKVGVQATLAFTVTNEGTGPTTGAVDLSIPLPLDLTLTNATGTGWACRNAGTTTSVMNVACTTNAVAEAGASLPVVSVVVTPKAAGSVAIGATVSTPGSTDGTVTADVVVAATSTPGTDTPGQGAGASGLPFTGGELAVLLDGAVAALGIGGGLVGWARTRRRKAPRGPGHAR